jgi:hypothetical protein
MALITIFIVLHSVALGVSMAYCWFLWLIVSCWIYKLIKFCIYQDKMRKDKNPGPPPSEAPSSSTYNPSLMSADISLSRILQTTNDVIPFLSQLNVFDDELKEMMDGYNELARGGAEEQIKKVKSQKNLQMRLDEMFEVERMPDGEEKKKRIDTLKKTIYYYRKKLEKHDEKLDYINLKLNEFDIIKKRALHTMAMMKLFNSYNIEFVDELSRMMGGLSMEQPQPDNDDDNKKPGPSSSKKPTTATRDVGPSQ